jgi:hypothetical protein
MFLWQQRIVEGVVFYAVSVVSKESRQLVVPRTSRVLKGHSPASVLGMGLIPPHRELFCSTSLAQSEA